jgi:hypothetical protein
MRSVAPRKPSRDGCVLPSWPGFAPSDRKAKEDAIVPDSYRKAGSPIGSPGPRREPRRAERGSPDCAPAGPNRSPRTTRPARRLLRDGTRDGGHRREPGTTLSRFREPNIRDPGGRSSISSRGSPPRAGRRAPPRRDADVERQTEVDHWGAVRPPGSRNRGPVADASVRGRARGPAVAGARGTRQDGILVTRSLPLAGKEGALFARHVAPSSWAFLGGGTPPRPRSERVQGRSPRKASPHSKRSWSVACVSGSSSGVMTDEIPSCSSCTEAQGCLRCTSLTGSSDRSREISW